MSRQLALGSGNKLLGAAAVFGAILATAPLYAEEPELAVHVCALSGGEVNESNLQTVYAGCWGTGLVLGEAERFEASFNKELGATAVELEREGKRRLLVIHALPDGQPIIEDMGSVLAEAMGRTPLGNTDELSVDLEAFAESGLIGVTQTWENAAGAGGEQLAARGAVQGSANTAATARIDVGAFIQNDPARANAQSDQ